MFVGYKDKSLKDLYDLFNKDLSLIVYYKNKDTLIVASTDAVLTYKFDEATGKVASYIEVHYEDD